MWERECFACSTESCISFDNYRQYDTEAWWISEASLRDYNYHYGLKSQILANKKLKIKNELFPIMGHTLTKGNGDALIFQRFFKGWSGVSDTAHLMRITIIIPEHLKGKGDIQIKENSDVIVFLTDGMPSFRDFCIGYAIEGTIKYTTYPSEKHSTDPSDDIFFSRLLHIDRGVKATISITATLVDSMGSQEVNCEKCAFNADLVFKSNDITSINQNINR